MYIRLEIVEIHKRAETRTAQCLREDCHVINFVHFNIFTWDDYLYKLSLSNRHRSRKEPVLSHVFKMSQGTKQADGSLMEIQHRIYTLNISMS